MKNRVLGFDIETIPGPLAEPYWSKHLDTKLLNMPDFFAEMPNFSEKYKKAETVLKHQDAYITSIPDLEVKWANDREAALTKEVHGCGLSGTFGLVVTWVAWDGKDATGGTNEDYSSEKEMLNHMWETLADADVIAGYNLKGFDIPLLLARSVACGAKVPRSIAKQKTWDPRPVVDLMDLFGGKWNLKHKKFEHACLSLGIPAKSDIDGSQVWAAYKRGELDRIYKYNIEDSKGSYEMYMKALEAMPWL